MRPAAFLGYPEHVVGQVLVSVLCRLWVFSQKFSVAGLEGVGDVFEEYQAESNVLVVARLHVAAQIVADRFHVVRLVNQHFLKLWQQYDPEGRKNRGLLSLMRRHHWKLSAIQKERLHQYLGQEPVLQALYFAKQQLNGFLVLKTVTRKRAKQILPKFLRLLEQFEHSPARSLAATLRSWLEPIVAMWRFSKTNGITEGFHTTMEMLSRRAYGFRNFENYRLRVLAQCGWDGVINRV